MRLPREAVWEFVKDMNNWAPFLTGYQKHEILDETDSIWTLKGDVGHPERASSSCGARHRVERRRERVVVHADRAERGRSTAAATLVMAPRGRRGSAPRRAGAAPEAVFFAAHPRRALPLPLPAACTARAPVARAPAPGAGGRRRSSSSRLRMDAGGPTGPLVNAMLAPALLARGRGPREQDRRAPREREEVSPTSAAAASSSGR